MASRRIWIPFALAALCLVAATWTGAILSWILLVGAFCLVLDGATTWWSRTGGMGSYRQ